MISPLPTFPKTLASAAFFGSLSKLFLFDARTVAPGFVFWQPEPLPASFVAVDGVKVYFHPGTAAVTSAGSKPAGGPQAVAEITFETINDSAEVLAWLTSLMPRPLFALAYPVTAGFIRGFQTLYLTYEYKNTGDYAAAPRYLVTLSPKGLAKIWYTDITAGSGPVLPIDPDGPEPPVQPNLNAFDNGFDEGFIKP